MAEIAFRVGPTVKWISGINEQTTCKVGSSFFSLHGRSSPSCLNPAKVNFGALATCIQEQPAKNIVVERRSQKSLHKKLNHFDHRK